MERFGLEGKLRTHAAVAALFNAIDRIANATGIPLEDAKAEDSEELRANLGVNEFYSAINSPL